jgi:hypothetical protein
MDESLLVLVGQFFQSLPLGFRNKQRGEDSSQHEEGKNFEAGGERVSDVHIQRLRMRVKKQHTYD